MEIEAYIKKIKNIYSEVMDYIESADDAEKEFEKLNKIFNTQVNIQSKEETRLLFRLTSVVANHYHQTHNFFDKLGIIIHFIIETSNSSISDYIDDIKNFNRRLLFHLLDKKYIIPDQKLINNYIYNKSFVEYYHYLYPVMKQFLDKNSRDRIEKSIISKYDMSIDAFTEKCRLNENDLYICSLIREDSIEDFIEYVNKKNISLSGQIKPSFFETNQFLMNKSPTLIEYASFYGSIQIIQYLKSNNVELTDSLWQYAVHSKSAELIYFLIENHIQFDKNFFFESSIKCHHNNITDYMRDEILYNKTGFEFFESFFLTIYSSCNIYYYPSEVTELFSFHSMSNFFKELVILSQTTTITIPSSVTSISSNLLSDVIQLKSVTFLSPSSVTKIGRNAFDGCSSLEQIIIPSSVNEIESNAFKNCSSLTQVSIPSSVTHIGYGAFSGCSSLIQISIPSSVEMIESNTFDGCSSLKQISIHFSINFIGSYAFNGCSSLEHFQIPSNLKRIKNNTFSGCSSLKNIEIPSSIIHIGYSAFDGCSSLKQIIIPSSVNEIEKNTFKDCSSLTQVSIPYSVTRIGYGAFSGCSSLEQISIPSSVTFCENDVFSGCSSLKEISIPSSICIKNIDLSENVKISLE